jgi:hypothetical protein
MFTFLVIVSTPKGYAAINFRGGDRTQDYYLYDASLALSLATNLIVTLLIAYKLWYGAKVPLTLNFPCQ